MNENLKPLLLLFALAVLITVSCKTGVSHKSDSVVAIDTTKIDEHTGFVMAPNYELVIAHCTGCHSAKLVIQYRGNRTDWLNKIRWMQEKQNLWNLEESEPLILDYLARNYPAVERNTRRKTLKVKEWYEL